VTAARRGNGKGGFKVIFGEELERWSLTDPCHPRVAEAHHRARYGEPTKEDVLLLASVVSEMGYLLYTCPTTTEANSKLAAMRAAVRKIPNPPEDE